MYEDPYYTDSIIRPGCVHYRLRQDRVILGYMQIGPTRSVYYSKDNFWWRSEPIEFKQKDRSTEIYDANRQMIFEHDLVRQRRQSEKDYTKVGIVVWNAARDRFDINYIEEGKVERFQKGRKPSPFRDDLKVSAQMFPVDESP